MSDIADHARRQATALQAMDDPETAIAVEHLRRIASIGDSLWPSTVSPDSAQSTQIAQQGAALEAQLRIDHSSLPEGLNALAGNSPMRLVSCTASFPGCGPPAIPMTH